MRRPCLKSPNEAVRGEIAGVHLERGKKALTKLSLNADIQTKPPEEHLPRSKYVNSHILRGGEESRGIEGSSTYSPSMALLCFDRALLEEGCLVGGVSCQ